MKRHMLVLVLLFLVGCGTKSPEPSQSPVTITPAWTSVDGRTSPLTPPSPTVQQDLITSENMTSQLEPYESDLFGVSFSYPENLDKPEVTQSGFQTLKLFLGNGEIFITRQEAKPEKSLQDLAKENIDANTKASNGRNVSKDLGKQKLGGEEAWGVQHYFDSAAGRTDGMRYFVLTGGLEFRVDCQTRQGPPVIPWEAVKPVCERILGTIKFGS